MNIRMVEVIEDKVKFSCAYGEGMGICVHANPEQGKTCDVEIDILPDLIIGVNTKVVNDNQQFVRIEGDETVFNVKVESIDEDDVWLRLSDDFVLIVEEIKGSVSIGDMLRINLKAEEIEIFTIGS